MWCPVVAPCKPPQAPCSSQAATQPAALEPGPNTPKPAPQPGRWQDRDRNAALNMQRIGESIVQVALLAKGKAYPGLGYKQLRDKPPKAQQPEQPVAQ
ncbi:hypothetical protein QJQ45_008444 [Haematococcus lacustris]|nr:hypothetical protein QJQ45_008444 [Haematococcus lacustris]